MKKLILLLTAISCISISVSAQNFCWANRIGGLGDEGGLSIAVDASGNVYTIGYFIDTVDFDPGAGMFNLISAGYNDIFVSKLDANGNFLWTKQMGGTNDDAGFSITVDASGNVYTTGFFQGTADFDPGPGTFNLTSAGGYDIFVSKLDTNGNFVWAKQMDGANDAQGFSITIDASGNVYTTGSFGFTVDFDPGPGIFNLTSAGQVDIFVSKLDANGNFVWAKKMGGAGEDEGYSIAIDDSGNVYTTGSFEATADFDPGPGTYNLTLALGSIFVSKLDSNGNFVWAKQLGGGLGIDDGYSITIDDSGNVYTTGSFEGTADFDPGPGTFIFTSAGGTFDIFVSKLDANGNFIWAKQMGGTDSDGGISIAIDASGNVYTVGSFASTADFDPGPGSFNLTSAGGYDIFVSKLDPNGNFVWAEQMAGISSDFCNSIAVDDSGNVYTTGRIYFSADFDPGSGTFNLTSAGGWDIFVSKLCLIPTGTEENNFSTAAEIFPNPFSVQTILQTEAQLKHATITVSNCYGQTVREIKNINGQRIALTRGSLTSGLYFVQLMQDNKVIATKKIVITD